jgi:hypothetical protein
MLEQGQSLLSIHGEYKPILVFPAIYRHKAGKGAVKGPLHIVGKDTGGKLIKIQVIGNTLTALALPGTGLIGAIADGFIGFNLAFHSLLPF